MPRVYIYVVDRDFGFAPNPFHGFCTLATCKPGIRSTAQVGDWIIGVGGGRLKATGKCVFAMKVSRKITFNEYWADPAFNDKKPVRNGSRKMIIGDNIYRQNSDATWQQSPSHHSHVDGTVNEHNLKRDTKSPNVLISSYFYYFGSGAKDIPIELLTTLGYRNGRSHRIFDVTRAAALVEWVDGHSEALNKVQADPFDFNKSASHYSVKTNKISAHR